MIYKKIDISEAYSYNVSIDAAKEFIDHRVLLKCPLTQRAFDRAMKQALTAGHICGITPDEAIEITIDEGWRGCKASYIKNELQRRQRHEAGKRGNQQYQTRSSRADDQLLTVIDGGRTNGKG